MRKKITEVGMTPIEVAQLVGVHVRTIFRWVENSYLRSKEGRVNFTDAKRIVDALNSSYTNLKARGKLGISYATLKDWKDRGVLESVNVAGAERVLKSSVEKVLEVKKGRRVNFHPDYLPVWDLLKVTGLECKILNGHIESGAVKSEVLNGKRMIPLHEFHRIKKLMDSTLRPIDAARILQKSTCTILDWRRNGRLKEVTVLGNKRVAVESITTTNAEQRRLEAFLRASSPEEKEKLEAKRMEREEVTLEKARVRGLEAKKLKAEKARAKQVEAQRLRVEKLERERLQAEATRLEVETERLRLIREAREARLVNIRPITLRELGSLKVFTSKQASERVDKPVRFIEELFRKGALRGRMVDEKIYIIVSSLEVYERRLQK